MGIRSLQSQRVEEFPVQSFLDDLRAWWLSCTQALRKRVKPDIVANNLRRSFIVGPARESIPMSDAIFDRRKLNRGPQTPVGKFLRDDLFQVF